MSVWGDLVGQADVVAALSTAARAAASEPVGTAMTHAWLFTGPPGSGRSTAALAFTAALLCPQQGCGSCRECQTALSGAHADVERVRTEKTIITVAETRALVQLAQRRPSVGRWRVIVLEDADRLQPAGANSLLKAIEEPPERTVWLLCAPSVEDVEVTIRSRCRRVGLRTPSVDAVADLLERRDGIDPALASYAARSAQSHIGLARRLATHEDARIRRREVVRLPLAIHGVGDAVTVAGQLVETATEETAAVMTERDEREREELLRGLGADAGARTQPPHVRAQLSALEKDQQRRRKRAVVDHLDRSLVDLMSVYRDVLVLQTGDGVPLVNEEMRDDLARLARAMTPERTVTCMEEVGRARERIVNAAPLLAVEAMCVALRVQK